MTQFVETAGKWIEKELPPELWQSSSFAQKAQLLIFPGHKSVSFGINLHLEDSISILKLYRSEKIFIRNRSAPFPPALKSKALLDE